MPTVPRYDELQVERAPIRRPRFPTDIPTGAAGVPTSGVAQGLSIAGEKVGGALEQEYRKRLAEQDQIAVQTADKDAAALQTRLLYDPDKGVLNLHGKDALKGRDVINEEWNKGIGEIETRLSGHAQKAAFRQAVLNRETSLHTTLAQHIGTELQNYDTQETQSYLVNERNSAVAATVKGVSANAAMDNASMSIARQRAAISQFAKRRGFTPEQTEQALQGETSRTHLAVIEQMVANNDDLTAKKYYDEMKDGLKGDDAKRAATLVQAGSLRGESQRQADALVTKFGADRQGALDAVKKISNPEIRDSVQERVVHEFNLQDAIKKDGQEVDYFQATKLIEPYVRSGRPFLASEVVPQKLWNNLPLEARNALQRRAGDRENDSRTWHAFLELTPQQLGSLNLLDFESKYWAKFDNQTRHDAERMWQVARDGMRTGKLDPKTSSDETFKDIVNLTMRRTGLLPRNVAPGKMSQSQYDMYAAFSLEAMRQKEAAETAKGKPLTGTEVQAIADKIALKTIFIDDNWIRKDPQRLPSQVSQDEKKRAYVPWDVIPETERNAIQKVMKANGKLPTRDRVQRLYAAQSLGDRQLWDAIMKEK